MRKTDVSFCLTEMVTLSTPFILLIILHFCYVFMQMSWSLYWCYLPPHRRSASHAHSLPVSPLVSSLPLFLSHIKMHGNLFWIIIDYNKVLWRTSLFHLKRAEHNKTTDIESLQNRLLNVFYVPTTRAGLPRLFYAAAINSTNEANKAGGMRH